MEWGGEGVVCGGGARMCARWTFLVLGFGGEGTGGSSLKVNGPACVVGPGRFSILFNKQQMEYIAIK